MKSLAKYLNILQKDDGIEYLNSQLDTKAIDEINTNKIYLKSFRSGALYAYLNIYPIYTLLTIGSIIAMQKKINKQKLEIGTLLFKK